MQKSRVKSTVLVELFIIDNASSSVQTLNKAYTMSRVAWKNQQTVQNCTSYTQSFSGKFRRVSFERPRSIDRSLRTSFVLMWFRSSKTTRTTQVVKGRPVNNLIAPSSVAAGRIVASSSGLTDECTNLVRQASDGYNNLYTQRIKKSQPSRFCHNFVRCWPIFEILSVAHLAINLTINCVLRSYYAMNSYTVVWKIKFSRNVLCLCHCPVMEQSWWNVNRQSPLLLYVYDRQRLHFYTKAIYYNFN